VAPHGRHDSGLGIASNRRQPTLLRNIPKEQYPTSSLDPSEQTTIVDSSNSYPHFLNDASGMALQTMPLMVISPIGLLYNHGQVLYEDRAFVVT
jgi:hypothetical protein